MGLQAGLISRQLSNINRRFTTNLERLSTGLRLNRPDDSPGQYGVVINQNLQIQSLNQGVVNAQNAAGMLQTAEEGINTIIDVLTRAHDLAVTAADATLTQAQRQQAQDEVDRLLTSNDGTSEIQQILDNVNYNGVKLLADSEKSAAVQAGAVGAAGGKREVNGIQGGDKVSLLSLTGSTASASLALTTAVGALSGGNNFDHLTAANSPGLDLVGMEETKSGMLINMSVVGDTVQKGDILELTYKNKSGTTTDQVIVAAMYESAGGTHGQDDVVVFNAEGHTVGLDLYDLLTSTTNNTHSEFREVMHVGVALKASGGQT